VCQIWDCCDLEGGRLTCDSVGARPHDCLPGVSLVSLGIVESLGDSNRRAVSACAARLVASDVLCGWEENVSGEATPANPTYLA